MQIYPQYRGENDFLLQLINLKQNTTMVSRNVLIFWTKKFRNMFLWLFQ